MPHLLFQVKPSTDGQPWHSSGQIFTRIAINISQSQENIFFPPVLKSLSQIKSKYCSTNWLGYALDVSCSNKSTMDLNVVCSYQTSLDHLTITSSYTNLDQNSASESRLTSKSKLSPSRHLCIELFFL